jgi:TonB family protein
VVLRIRIAKNGEVSKTELITRKANPAFASLALQSASQWDFDPARVRNKPVPSDMLVHFRFRAPR